MPDTLLHWNCSGVTYSVRRFLPNQALLFITRPNGKPGHGRRPIPLAIITAWGELPIAERCVLAEKELERREHPRPGDLVL